mmetsp:Transcript_29464/g.75128  ORF Transcript_29464/g.75128 Transcript_29464/m.75128 type:complete len:112 (-) Transcript_29464:520-855(-)
MDPATIATVDGEELTLQKARKQAVRSFYAGFVFLPLLWLVNVWLFWPDFIGGRDPVLCKYTRRSAVCLSIWSAVFLPWFLFYVSVGDRYLDPEVYRKLDVTRWGINDYIGI